MTFLAHALGYARKGWPVFPLLAKDKRPANEHGFKEATLDPEKINRWWATSASNIGVATGAGAGMFVLDVDDHEGLASIQEANGDLPETLTAQTGTGGLHLVFAHPGQAIRNRARFHPGLDVRGDGGYIVVAPSIHPNGRTYEWVRKMQPVPAPPWLLALVVKPKVIPGVASDRVFSGVGTPWGLRCLDEETHRVAAAAEGARNDTLYAAACQVFGAVKGGQLDEGTAWAALEGAGRSSGLGDIEVRASLRSALDNTEPRSPAPPPLRRAPVEPPPEAYEEPPDEPLLPIAEDEPEPRLRVLTRSEMDSIPPPQWLVAGMITTGFTVIYGAPASGKTFLALDWACHAATGTPWFGRSVLRRRPLYVAAEGISGIPRRIAAWERDRRCRAEDMLLVPQVVNLRSAVDLVALGEEVEKRHADLLVVDTFARSMPGGDENAAQDVGMVVHSLTELAQATGCAVIVLHHTGVDGRRERGSGSLRGASDTMVRCDATPGIVKVTCDKQKDDEDFSPWQLRMKPVGESVVLSLAAGLSSDDKVDRVMGALGDGMLMSYPELVKVADGDGELVMLLVDAGKIESVEQGNAVRYRTTVPHEPRAHQIQEATA